MLNGTEVTLFGFEGAKASSLLRRFFAGKQVGVDCGEGPPVPIPNTEVKLTRAEDTCLETNRENR